MGFTFNLARRMRSVPQYTEVECDRCGKRPPIQKGCTSPDWLQYDNVLLLRLEGGYGMFIDPAGSDIQRTKRIYDARYDKILCHECAHEFAEWIGWDVHNQHTHAPESGQHADHHDGAIV